MKKFILLSLALVFSMHVFSQNNGGFTPDQLLKLEEIFKPARAKIEAELKKSDPKKFDAWMSAMKQLTDIPDTDERQKAAADLQAAHAEFFKKGYAKAGINESDFQKKVFDLFKSSGYVIKFGQFLAFTATMPPPAPAPETGGGTCAKFTCKFNVQDSETRPESWGNGYGMSSVAEDQLFADCGLTSKSNVMVNGRCDQWMAAGEYMAIPAGTARAEVSAPVERYWLKGDGSAGFGAGYAYSNCGIYVSGEGVEHFFIYDQAAAYSPFGGPRQEFLFNKTGQTLKAEFAPAAGGGDYKIQLFASTVVWTFALGGAASESIFIRPKHLQVCLFKK